MKKVHTPPTFCVAMATKINQFSYCLKLTPSLKAFHSIVYFSERLASRVDKTEKNFQKLYKIGSELYDNELSPAASSHLVDHKNSWYGAMATEIVGGASLFNMIDPARW